jgi:hypothetical protein
MSDYDNRIARLEFRADATDISLKDLKETQEVFGDGLQAIQKTLLQIKYALYGGGFVFALSTLGLKETILKLVLH